MDWKVPDAKCKQLLGLTSDGKRVICGKSVLTGVVGHERCSVHEEYAHPALVSFELRADLVERLTARAEAYGVKTGDMLTRMIEIGFATNADAPQ